MSLDSSVQPAFQSHAMFESTIGLPPSMMRLVCESKHGMVNVLVRYVGADAARTGKAVTRLGVDKKEDTVLDALIKVVVFEAR